MADPEKQPGNAKRNPVLLEYRRSLAGLAGTIWYLASGGRNDICVVRAVLDPFALTGKLILAGEDFDSTNLSAGWSSLVVWHPKRITAIHAGAIGWHTYKKRHLVENLPQA